MIRTTASWILLIVAFILFAFAACLADCVTKLLYKLGKMRASRRCFLALNQFTELLLKLWGTRIEFDASALNIDPQRPVLFIASHHSSLDVCLLGTQLARYIGHRKLGFVCRHGLDRWLPAYSFYARQYCYSLPRKSQCSNSAQTDDTMNSSLSEYAERIDRQGGALVFFPEGVKPLYEVEHCRSFRRKGLRILLKNMPNAQIVPIGIAGTRAFFTTPRCLTSMVNIRPSFNRSLCFQVLPTLQLSHSDDVEHVIDILESQISSSYERLSGQSQTLPGMMRLSQKWTL